MTYGHIEVSKSCNETETKGTPAYSSCTEKTKDGMGRGISKFFGGLWRVATFWYPEDEAVK
ncbi:hypothetical protein OMAG_002050 [Candidatus Omnitrophus magneticus]|uniref:Uncharacterized protein n=1 Tax=Candidatus Omnitrophus magneticus TaxID=1609969 RepID=A0A0F0CRA7_9BACT|nr:hypothetical protein OMAG_002050 [Candidatus Omnitrophus magneticus]